MAVTVDPSAVIDKMTADSAKPARPKRAPVVPKGKIVRILTVEEAGCLLIAGLRAMGQIRDDKHHRAILIGQERFEIYEDES